MQNKNKYVFILIQIFIYSFFISCQNNPALIVLPSTEIKIIDSITALNCGTAILNPTNIKKDSVYNGTVSIPYTGGIGINYSAGNPIKLNGLTATLQAGKLATGNGNLIYTLTGTPTLGGVNNFPISFVGKSCTFTVNVFADSIVNPSISTLNCAGVILSATATNGTAYTGTATIPYTGGNKVNYATGQAIASTGVIGLNAILQGGTLSTSGTLSFNISGTPTTSGNANFSISFGGQTCSFILPVTAPQITYNNTIKTIYDANCALSGCHNGVTNQKGYNYSTYTASKQFSLAPYKNTLLNQLNSGSMPKDRAKLSQTQIDNITTWINNGCPE